MNAEHELIIRKVDGATSYDWFLARAGHVVERGCEPGLALCLVSASSGLDPAAEVDVNFDEVAVQTYRAEGLQRATSTIAYELLKSKGTTGRA